MVLSEKNESSFDLCSEERPVSKSSCLHRVFVASFTLIAIFLGTLVYEKYRPSVAHAGVTQKPISISTQPVQKSCISPTNEPTPHFLNSTQTSNSFLGNPVSERATLQRKRVEQIPPIHVNGFFVSMERKTFPKPTFAYKVEKTPFSIAIENQKYSQRNTRNVFVEPPDALPSFGDFQTVVQVYESLNNREKKKMETVETFIKDNKIVNPDRIVLVKETSAKLMEQNLSLSKRGNVVLNALELTSRSCCNLASRPAFTEQDKDVFLQDSRIASFLLKTGFPPKNPSFTKIVKKNIAKLRGSTVSLSYNDREIWQTLQYKALGIMASDLAVELTQLRWDLGTEQPYFTSVVKVSSLTKDYFKMQISQLENIVQKGWEEQISANKEQNAAFTSTVIRVDDLRGKTLISYYDKIKISEACFEDELFSVTGNKLSNIRDQRSISEIIDVKQLNATVLSRHGFCSNARPHFEEWLKSYW